MSSIGAGEVILSVSSVIERVRALLVTDRRLKDTVETLVLRLSKSQEQTCFAHNYLFFWLKYSIINHKSKE